MRKNKLKQMFKDFEPIINGWLQIPGFGASNGSSSRES